MTTVEALKHLFIGSGTSWVLYLLGALSIASLAISVERWFCYKRRDADLPAVARDLDRRLAAGDRQGAIDSLLKSPSVAATIAAAGLRLSHLGAASIDKAMLSATALERSRLEKRLAYLGTLGNNAPFVGLFGTVIGIIQAFEELGHGAPGHGTASGATASAASQVASQAVMSGIAEALVATAVGIAVALPAVAAYNFLQRRVTSLLGDAEVLSNLVLAYAPAGGAERVPAANRVPEVG